MAITEEAFEFAVESQLPTGSRHQPDLVEREGSEVAKEVDVASLAPGSAALRHDEFRVVLDVESDRGGSELELPLRVDSRGERSWRVHGVAYHLVLDIDIGPAGGEIHWRLLPGGQDAAARAQTIDLLHALSGQGVLVLRDPESGVLARMRLDGYPEIEGLAAERAFLTDVLAVEAWSGVRLPVPNEPDDKSLDLLSQVAALVRAEGMRVRFTSDITGLTSTPIAQADELRLHEEIEYQLWSLWLPLGQAHYTVRVRVTSTGATPAGKCRTTFRPTEDWLWAPLTPPTVGASERVRLVDAGGIPGADDAGPTRRVDAVRRATELVADWALGEPEDRAIREEFRRRWPT